VSTPALVNIRLRPGRPEDAPELGRINYEAFSSIAGRHGYPPDVSSVEAATVSLRGLLNHPKFYSVVAESSGRILGSNFLDERSIVTGVGPITVDPLYQNSSVGKELMLDVMRRSNEIGAAGIRLVQAAWHTRSLALYTKLGFEVREQLSNINGAPPKKRIEGREVRKATEGDLQACNLLCESTYGFNRGGEVSDSIKNERALVVEHEGRITGYSTHVMFFGHSVGETNDDMMALISSVPSLDASGVLVPTRNFDLMKWCLQNGLRIGQQRTLMTMGLYNEPHGAYLPSIYF